MANACFINYKADLINTDAYADVLNRLSRAGHTCYRTEDTSATSSEEFMAKLIRNGHLSVLEHVSFTLELTMDRGLSHEMVRHRLASYSQESTRYVQYKAPIPFILPYDLKEGDKPAEPYVEAAEYAATLYLRLIENGHVPGQARAILPNFLATKMVMTANIREWMHILQQRYFNNQAHRDMRKLSSLIYDKLSTHYPVFFKYGWYTAAEIHP